MPIEIKNCPFCGSESAMAFVMNPPVYIQCQMCNIEFTILGATGRELTEAWDKRSSGIKDMRGAMIFEGDKLRFSDKWEWYRGEYGIKMMFADEEEKKKLQAQYDAEPYEERIVTLPEDYEWLLNSEIQSYWEIVKP